jgi:RimJ/RimL family protein N-acetyltransferase
MTPMRFEDEEALTTLYADPLVGIYLPPLQDGGIPEMIKQSVHVWQTRGFGPAAIRLRESGRFVGKGGLNYVSRFDEVEVKWVLNTEYWGHGYATEAGQAWIDWCLDNTSYRYVVARILSGNRRSVQVAKRLNMTLLRQTYEGSMVVDMYATLIPDDSVHRPRSRQ